MGGLMVNLLNIKAFIFFAALFGGIILDASLTFQLSISLYFFLATTLWFCILSYSLYYGSKAFLNAAVQKIITRMSSLFLVLIGLSLGVYVWI
jgi:threonine/homoserine/homoserine lactone efflux protein